MQELAKEELTEVEAQVIIVSAEIGKASVQYWSVNLDEWTHVLVGEEKSTKRWFNFKECVGSDVAGAVGGAVTAAVVNAIPGAGQVGYAGAIVGGAAGASAAEAVSQVWNHYF
nr:hypothetical protein [uncultured Marinifilum sp.]